MQELQSATMQFAKLNLASDYQDFAEQVKPKTTAASVALHALKDEVKNLIITLLSSNPVLLSSYSSSRDSAEAGRYETVTEEGAEANKQPCKLK